MGNFGIGNTFGRETMEWNNGQKRIWREIRHRYPAGGLFTSEALTANAGKVIPAGTPVKLDQATKTLTILSGSESDLAVDGFTQEDVWVKDGVEAASATVIYAGELYEPVFKAAICGGDATKLAAFKAAAPKGVVFVR